VKADSQRIVHDAFGRFGRGKAYQEERARLRAEARRRMADALACASLWRRVSIYWEIERQVRAELQKKYPRWALYAACGPS
jgi:hypothetical protein